MSNRIYLDHAATTPVRSEVRDAMLPFLGEDAFGNPSSAHAVGRAARAGVERAREQVAEALGAEPKQVFFTSGGTEADNLAVLGGVQAASSRTGAAGDGVVHVVTSPTEHHAVTAAAHEAERRGAFATFLPVDGNGLVDLAALDRALAGRGPAGRPALVSVMWVNNEVGTVQPVGEIAERCAAAGVAFHTDAVQALGKVPVDLRSLPWTAVSVSAHKIGGPKGVGALVVKDPSRFSAILRGGSQQQGLRPGTENVPGIVGFGRAAELAAREQAANAAAWNGMRGALEDAIRQRVPDVVVHGAGATRAPNIVNLSAPGTDSESVLMHLDLAGIAAASGSACTTGSVEPSHVLLAMGVPPDLAAAGVRFSFGSLSASDQVPRVAETYATVVAKVRQLRRVLSRA
ncbi:MAG TPA: cysteine desulfurase family protein [Gemmatimonadales bacterium]|nr:cysteine desulfurase family protein [Gemmatimonadales bacterium]